MGEGVASVAVGVARYAAEACELVAVDAFDGYGIFPCVVVNGACYKTIAAGTVEYGCYLVGGYFVVVGEGVVAVSCVAVVVEGYPDYAVS